MQIGKNGGLTFVLIEDTAAWSKLGDDWGALLAAGYRQNPMLELDWLWTWWKYYNHGRKLAIGAFFDGAQLVALAPLCRRWFAYRYGLFLRRLEFLGAGFDEKDGVCSDYLGLIVRSGHEEAVAKAFIERLYDGSFGNWDECVLEMIDAEHPMLAPLRAALAAGGRRLEYVTAARVPFVKLPAQWEAFLWSLSKKRRASIRYALRDFEVWAGSLGYALHRASDLRSLESGLRILTSLHTERWNAVDKSGAFASRRFSAFHREYTFRLLKDGRLELVWLVVGGEPVAISYCVIGARTIYFYQCGRKMGVPRKIRAGIVMLCFALQKAIRDGFDEFDFLAGEAHYKSLFARESREMILIRIARPSLREGVLVLLKRLRDASRRRAERKVHART